MAMGFYSSTEPGVGHGGCHGDTRVPVHARPAPAGDFLTPQRPPPGESLSADWATSLDPSPPRSPPGPGLPPFSPFKLGRR
jgi:hypothetical protein